MNRTFVSQYLFVFVLLIFLPSTQLMAEKTELERDRINLALRQAAHQLLLTENDSSSVIPPIEYEGEHGYVLSINSGFNYNRFPALLHQALKEFGINENYVVIVKDCKTEETVLGYRQLATDQEVVACGQREQTTDCVNVHLQIEESEIDRAEMEGLLAEENASIEGSEGPDDSPSLHFVWLLIPLAAGVAVYFLRASKRAERREEEEVAEEKAPLKKGISLGQYVYDPKNLELILGEEKRTLTYRENKLLHLFALKPNEVLTREEIQGAVWEDEGIIVGRSLDVFISRLRKMFKGDADVQIKNVHGVGYKLEVPESVA